MYRRVFNKNKIVRQCVNNEYQNLKSNSQKFYYNSRQTSNEDTKLIQDITRMEKELLKFREALLEGRKKMEELNHISILDIDKDALEMIVRTHINVSKEIIIIAHDQGLNIL